MECNELSFNAVARVNRIHKKGMFGLVLEVPNSVVDYTGARFWLVFGNSCFYCNTTEDVDRVCREHGWDARFLTERRATDA